MLTSFARRLKKGFSSWWGDRSGVVAMVVVFTLPAFVAAAGVAVDLAQGYNIKTRLSAALDKAALAAGSTEGSTSEIEDRINKYLEVNYPAEALGTPYSVSVVLIPGYVDITAQANVKTVFMNIFGQEYINVQAQTIVKREISGLELVLVMDNTGSMTGSAGGGVNKLQASKNAAKKLLDILFGTTSEVPVLFVGVVPFSQNVNVGSGNASWTSGSYNWGPTSWGGCVEAREAGGRDITDDPPMALEPEHEPSALFPKYYYYCHDSSNVWYSSVTNVPVNNGTFSSDTGWTKQSGWSISGGDAVKSGSNDAYIYQDWPPLNGSKDYKMTFTIEQRNAGSIRGYLGGASGTYYSSPGIYTDTFNAGSSNNLIGLYSNNFNGVIDDFSLQELDNCGTSGTIEYDATLDENNGPNKYCVQPLLGMTDNKATIEASIDSMEARGATMINLGLAWGWRMLSPRWQGLWGGVMDTNGLPLDYDTPSMNKVVILMTDGDNTFSGNNYTAYDMLHEGHIGTTSSSTAASILDTRTSQVCNAMKANNILIYTIAFGTGVSTTSQNLLRNCATSPAYYFNSPSAGDLDAAFTTIANQLNSLHIVH